MIIKYIRRMIKYINSCFDSIFRNCKLQIWKWR